MKVSASVTALTQALGVALMGLGLMSPADVHAGEIMIASARQNLDVTVPGQTTGTQRYIVTFGEAGVLNYDGGVASLSSTAPTNADGHRKLDVHASAAKSYAGYLADQRATHIDAINSALHRVLMPTHLYSITRNGMAASRTVVIAEPSRP